MQLNANLMLSNYKRKNTSTLTAGYPTQYLAYWWYLNNNLLQDERSSRILKAYRYGAFFYEISGFLVKNALISY